MPVGPFNINTSSITQDAVLGLNLLTGTLNADVVGVFDQATFTQLFVQARSMKAFVRETSRVMEHPLETGALIADHKIIDPKTIDLMMIVAAPDFNGAFQQIRNSYLNSQLLIVQTKAAVYKNMIIQSLPREEDPEKFNVTVINLQLREVLYASETGTSATSSVSYYSPADPSNQSQILRGLQNAITGASTILSGIHAASTWGFIK
jgi:hypothetical protein